MFLKSHDLQGVIAKLGNLRKDIQTEFLECADLFLFRRHTDMALIDQRMLALARPAVLPLVWLRIPYLGAELLRHRVLHATGRICRNSFKRNCIYPSDRWAEGCESHGGGADLEFGISGGYCVRVDRI